MKGKVILLLQDRNLVDQRIPKRTRRRAAVNPSLKDVIHAKNVAVLAIGRVPRGCVAARALKLLHAATNLGAHTTRDNHNFFVTCVHRIAHFTIHDVSLKYISTGNINSQIAINQHAFSRPGQNHVFFHHDQHDKAEFKQRLGQNAQGTVAYRHGIPRVPSAAGAEAFSLL